MESKAEPVSVLMVGTGEYTTGFVGGQESKSDKGPGVVALTMFDLRRRGYVGETLLAGVNGKKFPGIRAHMKKAIQERYPASKFDVTCRTFPGDDEVNEEAYLDAIKALPKQSIVTVFTPDDTHFDIALAAIEAGMHVLITKPTVKSLENHLKLIEAARKSNVHVQIEVHKRWDPMYSDARDRIQSLGPFSYMNAFMSQPKFQLETFKAWAGKSSDISYYLNSHHVDYTEWVLQGKSRPVSVVASAARGYASKVLDRELEDTITLTVMWENVQDGSTGVGVYTSSWIAATQDVHSQQNFHFMGQKGEVKVDQARRNFTVVTDEKGLTNCNPLYMKYTPANGKFVGQLGYGYRSIEDFVKAVRAIRAGEAKPEDFDAELPTIGTTVQTTAILEAGRRSLDRDGARIAILYEDEGNKFRPTSLKP